MKLHVSDAATWQGIKAMKCGRATRRAIRQPAEEAFSLTRYPLGRGPRHLGGDGADLISHRDELGGGVDRLALFLADHREESVAGHGRGRQG